MKKANVVAVNLSMSDNFFTLLNVPQEYEIDIQQLEANYIKLQQIFHPDKQVNKTRMEQVIALEYASKINKAYNILRDDQKRAEYLLSLVGVIINQEEGNNLNPDPSMLLEILELNENPTQFNIQQIKQECWEIFTKNFKERNFKVAGHAIIKLQFLNKL